NGIWLNLLVYVLVPGFQSGTSSSFAFFQRYEELGGAPTRLAVTFLANPVYVLRILLTPARIGGIGVLMAPVSLVLLCADPLVGVLLIPLLINFLSSLDQQHSFAVHYAMLPLVMVCAVAAYGAGGQGKPRRRGNRFSSVHLGTFAVVTTLVLFVWLSPLGLRAPETLSGFEIDAHDRIGKRVLERGIPASASVVAQNSLAPHLSQREHITLFPRVLNEPSDYYVFDVKGHLYPLTPVEYQTQVARVISDPDYGPICVENGYIILKKGAQRALVPDALRMLRSEGPGSRDE
ncbi:MAG: DUF2079 domain-containing protein, partial [Anaerolineae bacterium]